MKFKNFDHIKFNIQRCIKRKMEELPTIFANELEKDKDVEIIEANDKFIHIKRKN